LYSFLYTVSQVGFTDVYNMEGGIHAYATQANPSVGTY
jgi:predicted sulfurtransferase